MNVRLFGRHGRQEPANDAQTEQEGADNRDRAQRLRKIATVGALLVLLLVLLSAALLLLPQAEDEHTPEAAYSGLLAGLPTPDPDDPFAIVEAERGEFPTTLASLLADSATVSPGGGSPVGALLPLFEDAENAALVITEREQGLSMYGAISFDIGSPSAAPPLPQGWEDLFLMPEIVSTDLEGVMELQALNVTSPLYFSSAPEALYVTDSLYDMVRIQSVRDSVHKGIARICDENCDMAGHARVSDGGILAGLAAQESLAGLPNVPAGTDDEVPARDTTKIVTLDLSWSTHPLEGRRLADSRPSGDATWRMKGLEGIVSPVFLSSLSTYDWSQDALFIPDPLIASLGANLPAPGRNRRDLPQPLQFAAAYLEGMKLKAADISQLLTGPATLSLGGRTQVLWYELPGLVLDLPWRGESATKLIDAFWSNLFSSIKPKPLESFPLGGATDFPFSLMAAGDEKRSIIGLTSPAVDQNEHLKELVAGETDAIGWFYLDLPRLSSSITDMPYMSELLSQEEGTLLDDDLNGQSGPTDPLHRAFRNLGTIFVTWLAPNEGRAVWFR